MMKKYACTVFFIMLIGCSTIIFPKIQASSCNIQSSICEKNNAILVAEIKKFDAVGGAFVLMDLNNHKVLNASSVGLQEDFDYNQDFNYSPKNILMLLGRRKGANPNQFIVTYSKLVKITNQKNIHRLRDNVLKGTAREINIDGVEIYGLTATDNKSPKSSEVVTTFLGHFIHNGQEYALITLLDSPKGLKSTYGFNSSGWNATVLGRKIVEEVIEEL